MSDTVGHRLHVATEDKTDWVSGEWGPAVWLDSDHVCWEEIDTMESTAAGQLYILFFLRVNKMTCVTKHAFFWNIAYTCDSERINKSSSPNFNIFILLITYNSII